MSFLKQLSRSHPHDPTWVIFPRNTLVSLLRILVDVCTNFYAHLTITALGLSHSVLSYVYQEKFDYVVIVHFINLCIPCYGIINIFAHIWQRKSYGRIFERAIDLGEIETGSCCNITALVVSTYILLFTSVTPLFVLGGTKDWFKASTVMWSIWFTYNICQMANFCLVLSKPRFAFQQMCYSLSSNSVTEESIVRFIENYDVLVEMCSEIDGIFGPMNTFNIMFSFGTLVFQTFFVIGQYVLWMETRTLAWIAILSYTILLGGTVVLLIVGCCSVKNAAEKFNENLSRLAMRDTTGRLVTNPYITAHFAIGKKLKFSACSCFYIDYRLGYSMLAACITYLVILVEFDSKST